MARYKQGIKSGPQRIYEYLLDKAPGYLIADHTHNVHIPLHTGKLSSALSGLEKKGVIKAMHREPKGVSPGGRNVRGQVFMWLGPDPDIKFSGGHRPGLRGRVTEPGAREGITPRPLPMQESPLDPQQGTLFGLAPNREELQAIIATPMQPVPEPQAFLPAAPTLSEQLLLLAIQIDRGRKPGTPSSVFNNPNALRAVALPSRASVVERLLELATLAEQLEAEKAPAPALEESWRY